MPISRPLDVKNTGTETWGDIVDLIYISGAKFQTGGDAVNLQKSSVPTGETTEIIVDMLVPREVGTYKTVWHKLRRLYLMFPFVRIIFANSS
ncbi:MAG: hypothetical protein CL609_21805 [Anaerolineaceae bacterium]|nr:hypothetical protein [Anaerolineaceae bacterium]